MHRTNKANIASAPAHRLRDRQLSDRLLNNIRQQNMARLTRLASTMVEPLALIGLYSLQISNLDTTGAGKPQSGLSRLTIRSIGRL